MSNNVLNESKVLEVEWLKKGEKLKELQSAKKRRKKKGEINKER